MDGWKRASGVVALWLLVIPAGPRRRPLTKAAKCQRQYHAPPVPRPASIRIASIKDWEAILSPVRREIVESMQELGPCSIADVARATGRPADGLYRHVAILVKGGFLVEAGTRTGRRNPERLYDAAADDYHAPRVRRGGPSPERQMIVRTAEALARSTVRSMRGSAAAGRLHCEEDARNLAVVHFVSWLTPERFEEVRGLAHRMSRVLERGRKECTGDLYEVLVLASPVTRTRGTHTIPRKPARRKAPRR
jgi:predicted transcriptional regulator